MLSPSAGPVELKPHSRLCTNWSRARFPAREGQLHRMLVLPNSPWALRCPSEQLRSSGSNRLTGPRRGRWRTPGAPSPPKARNLALTSDHRPGAPFEATDKGLVPAGEGWLALNVREARGRQPRGGGESVCPSRATRSSPGRSQSLRARAGVSRSGCTTGKPTRKNFLVLSGEALLIIEREERRIAAVGFVHCPPETKRIIVGGEDAACVLLAVGAREHQPRAAWGGYTVDEAARPHGVATARRGCRAGDD